MIRKIAVVAIGGNSLIKDEKHVSVENQYEAARETCFHIANIIEQGWEVAIGHGNGPQVGFILRRSEIAAKHEKMHEVPLDVCGADSQGAIGYALQQNLQKILYQRGIRKKVVTVITQTLVDKDDPAFSSPTKPIGGFMREDEAKRRQQEQGWSVVEDAGRGWRRVVASPLPKEIVELETVETLLERGIVTITVGGGGIPVIDPGDGNYCGVAAVVDKDYASSLLAQALKADLFIISTAVEKVAIHFGKPEQQWLDRITLSEAKKYLAEGIHFAKGSMAPKIQAIIW
ncbi:MAG: carbamate kinase, partial [Anaerolineaceae bacterium]|nr:carbamate kinase [Anaerolineaceae bacterium]